MIVIDASALLELVLRAPAATRVENQILANGPPIAAPYLLDMEVAQVLHYYCEAGEISIQRAQEALEDLSAFPLVRYKYTPFYLRTWELRDRMTIYDGAYIALAEHLSAPLVTCDAQMLAASGHEAQILLL